MVDWSLPAQAIHNRVRGLQPWPGAYTTFRGQTLHIWKSRPGPCPRPPAPGPCLPPWPPAPPLSSRPRPHLIRQAANRKLRLRRPRTSRSSA